MTEEGKFLAIQAGIVGGALTIGAAWLFLTADTPVPQEVSMSNPDRFSDTQGGDSQHEGPTTIYDSQNKQNRTNPNTIGSTYQIIPHPEGKPTSCVMLEKSTTTNPQTIFGAAESLNNPKVYIDTKSFDIYIQNADGSYHNAGSFASSSMPDPNKYSLVQPETVVCEDAQ